MAWTIELTATAEKQLKKLDRKGQGFILDYLEDEVAGLSDPRSRGKGLVGDRKGIWRYRVGDYRILCQIIDAELVIVAVTIRHRRDVYGD
ncbi:MAG: type II toxin-antitoxin system RelE family toxin [Alkalispirochaetaceae bacterium]